ncbi:hypothetical protein KIN20_031086 [Parelaphostrongylus tenuis]|uniref:C2H2-type domain-containing protein n=1 Tax=Parelaphostrongylus tenuis TaxID=148309 RepID=A0AAD5R4N0_PARTN|nr:hypothetical protein KIN20_031086 [Parelaphostrongylus tenuis]
MHSVPSTSVTFEPPDEPVMDPCSMRCQECGEVKNTAKQLYNHLFERHNYDKTRIEDIKVQRKTRSIHTKALRKSKVLFICEKCGKPFLSRTGLLNHSDKIHGIVLAADVRISCPQVNCTARFFTYMEFAVHADVEHRFEAVDTNTFRIYKKQFSNVKDMQKWRIEKECETDTQFVMRSSETKFTYGKRVAMWICANGYSRKKSVACQPCPAFMRICERHCGTIDVVACFGHLGHPHSSLLTLAAD